MAHKSGRDYAREAANKRPKMRDCKKCGRRVWGGYFEVSWVFMDPTPLDAEVEARIIAQGIPTWDVRLIYGEWVVDYRGTSQFIFDVQRGYRHLVLASHTC